MKADCDFCPEIVFTVPNILTMTRILMALLAAGLFFTSRGEQLAVVLCVLACLLDALDGWCARTLSQCSNLGKHMDPLADKIVISVVFSVIAVKMASPIIWILFALMSLREFGITMLRVYRYRRGRHIIPPNKLGKAKMITQSVVGNTIIVVAYFVLDGFLFPVFALVPPLVLIVVLSYLSAYNYVSFGSTWRDVSPVGARIRLHGRCDEPERAAVVR